jgi:hypothetical protein
MGYPVMKHDDSKEEPDWVNPANDRKTAYTDEEIDVFVDSFIIGLDDTEWADIKRKYGEDEARRRIRASMIARDERNLVNITPKGSIN